jgi:transcription initiation factor TFIIH subunit 3
MAQDEEDPSLLVLVLDASAPFWAQRQVQREQGAAVSTFQDTLEALMVFLQSYLLMHRRNDLAVIACGRGCSQMLYPVAQFEDEGRSLSEGGVSTKELQACIIDGLQQMSAASSSNTAARSAMARSLSQGLCYIDRRLKDVPSTQARVLLVQADPDAPESYNAIMNCIFSAQKAQVPVDCCCVGANSMFLQQAADVTSGIYLHTQEPGILQHLLTVFLPSQSCRRYLKQRRQETVDFRAACFCHRKIIEIAYVCSVCLSVFCEFSPVCATCGTRATHTTHTRRRQLEAAAVAAAATSSNGSTQH